jgi:hypothetical protein
MGRKPERIVLIFAYHFPPENAIGGMRPYRFCRYLSQMGYRCHVITAAEQPPTPEFDSEYVPDPFVGRPRQGMGWQAERAIRKFLLPGATGIRWARMACRAALRFVRANPAAQITIFSTYPPVGAHLAAFQLARATSLPWIADYRDPLAGNPGNVGFSKLQTGILPRMERIFLDAADATIANTDAVERKWKATYPHRKERIHLIWNGFDPADRIEPLDLPGRDYRLFSHVGELYEGRDITGLLESIGRLIEAGRLDARHLRIRLCGAMRSDSLPPEAFLSRAKKEGWLELAANRVSKADALRLAQTSDGLILVQPHSAVQVPGKLFEYVQIGRPVLAYILPNTPIEDILGKSGIPYRCAFAGGSPEDLDNAVHDFFSLPPEPVRASGWFERNFDAKEQTRALADLIRSLWPEDATVSLPQTSVRN